MNQKFISGLTATLLITTTLATTHSSNAESAQAVSQGSEANHKVASNPSDPASPVGEVVKMGEQQSTQAQGKEESIAKIHSHELVGKKAATLYVRNIPVLTFVSSQAIAVGGVKMGATQTREGNQVAKLKSGSQTSTMERVSEQRQNSESVQSDPVVRATEIAAKLNQLYREGVDASRITVSWKDSKTAKHTSSDGESGRYIIAANKTTIVAVDAETMLPDTTHNAEQDALQVTNRLRRIIGDASPLKEVENKPAPKTQEISLGPIKFRVDGWASWYGPGFNGNASASGEIFNQNAMTAAHRSLPFGTQVQVTNLDNGRSVVVRINDRGPYVGDRVIDLSAGAARLIGVVQSGIAPVRLEVLERRRAVAAGN